ncbi:MAG: Nif11 domain [Bacteroidetes bacterium]|jgi:predicted ribosomally synthesized peptide with nif11-like leader|nr:Nif11 domain [Bacteroidota bacterium]
MSQSHAHSFFKDLDTNSALRKKCFSCRTKADLFASLKESGFDFTQEEFEQEVILQLFKCQTEEQFDNVRQKELWFKMYG